MKVLVTGASGFVGRELLDRLHADSKFETHAIARRQVDNPVAGVNYLRGGDLGSETLWRDAVVDMDVLVHTAARVHVMSDKAVDPLAEFRRINVAGTLNLARQASAAGVRRFIFISSIKVNGEYTPKDRPFCADDTPAPVDPYGISKSEAEEALRVLAKATNMEVTIIRPPLVYGPGVKGNFPSMMRWVCKGMPLPFGSVTENRRSLIAVENLVDLIARCIDHPAAANRTFLASDGEDLSTAELLIRIGRALGRPARLIAIPPQLLIGVARAVGRGDVAHRLLSSLQVDSSDTRALLGWEPPFTVDRAFARAARHFLRQPMQ